MSDSPALVMLRTKGTIRLLLLLLGASLGPLPADCCTRNLAPAEEDLRIWREFADLLRSGPLPDKRVAPYREDLRVPLRGFLEIMRSKAGWNEFDREPEAFRVGDQVHFLIPLTFDGQTASYCFSFVTVDGAWRFQHLESITLRLDRIGPLPATRFPDASEQVKAWIREELQVSREVWLFNALSAEKGREAALQWFTDGAGYALAARTWVPFVEASRGFILYLCWEQANLIGNEVSLIHLDDDRAEVRLRPMYFALYEKTAHLKQQIPFEEFRRLFEYRWQDRATSGGWKLDISYEGGDAIFRFSKPREQRSRSSLEEGKRWRRQ